MVWLEAWSFSKLLRPTPDFLSINEKSNYKVSKVQVFDTPQEVNFLRSNLMRFYFSVD